MLNIQKPFIPNHWVSVMGNYRADLLRTRADLISKTYKLTIPNANPATTEAALEEVQNKLRQLEADLQTGAPVQIIGSIVKTADGAAAAVHVISPLKDGLNQCPTVRAAIGRHFYVEATAASVFIRSPAEFMFEITGGIESQESAA